MANPLPAGTQAFDHPSAIDRGRGRWREAADYDGHVEDLILQVLFTSPGERINRPEFGCGLRRLVFAPLSESVANLVEVTVFQALTTWLGTVIKVDKVETRTEESALHVKISYRLTISHEQRLLNLEVPGP